MIGQQDQGLTDQVLPHVVTAPGPGQALMDGARVCRPTRSLSFCLSRIWPGYGIGQEIEHLTGLAPEHIHMPPAQGRSPGRRQGQGVKSAGLAVWAAQCTRLSRG